ncbi:MAG: LytTR family DNA-binding domain-containing protein [Ginsengibacter sp.]
MNAILIDDEPGNNENLKNLLHKHCPQVHVSSIATDIPDACVQIQKYPPDLIFLDIQMGTNSGFDLLTILPERNFEVIFVTAFDHYGIQAIKFSALDYLLKPVDIDELINAVDKAQKKIEQKKDNLQLDFLISHLKNPKDLNSKIALPQQQEIRYISIKDIVRCEAENTYTFFFLQNGDKILISKPLKEYDGLLQPYGFIRTHQTHLVNPLFVKSWLKEDGGSLLLENGCKIPVSRSKKEMVKECLSKNS